MAIVSDARKAQITRTLRRLLEIEKQSCRLLSLPQELRDEILEYLLVDNEAAGIHEYKRVRDVVHTYHSLCLVCTQLNNEAEDTFWEKNSGRFWFRFRRTPEGWQYWNDPC